MEAIRIALLVLALQGSGQLPAQVSGSVYVGAKSGHIFYYGKSVMGRVAGVRRKQGYSIPNLPETQYMALTGRGSCSHIGEWWSIKIGTSKPEIKMVVDCSKVEHEGYHDRRGLVGEVAYGTAVAHGFVKRGRAKAVVWYE